MTILPPEVAQQLRQAQRVVVLTGAGISAESGCAYLRDAQTGLWAQYDPHQLATPQAFITESKVGMGLVRLAARSGDQSCPGIPDTMHWSPSSNEFPNFNLVTQNIDGLHRKAGSREIVELHGNIFGSGALPRMCWLRIGMI